MRKFALALLLFCANASALYAQSFDPDHDRQAIPLVQAQCDSFQRQVCAIMGHLLEGGEAA
jgi:hypothetical protein